jgi:cell division protein FtsZ
LMAVGHGTGDDRARAAAEAAISSGLLDVTIDGARGILFNITGGSDLTLFEVNEAAAIIQQSAHPEVNMIFGAQVDETMGDEIRITVIATGFEQSKVQQRLQNSTRRSAPTPPVSRPQPVEPRREQQPVEQRREMQRPPAPTPQPPTSAPEPRREQQEYNVYEQFDDIDNIDLPSFIRNRGKDRRRD